MPPPFNGYTLDFSQLHPLDHLALIETWEQWAARYATVNDGRRPWNPWGNPR